MSADLSSSESNTTSSSSSSSRKKSVSMRRLIGRVLMPVRSCRSKRVDVIDHLKENDEEFTVLKLDGSCSGLNVDRLIDAIQKNATVRSVHLHGGLVCMMSVPQQTALLDAVGNLPQLQELHFKCFSEFPLTFEGANFILERAKNIKKLTIYDSVLYGRQNNDELISLSEHKALEVVFLSQIRIPDGSVLDPIIKAFASAPSLSNLTVRIPRKKKGLVSDETLSLLTSLETLKSLELRRVVLEDDQIIKIAKDMENNAVLKELTLQCEDCLRGPCCTALGEMLTKNSSITRLEVWGQQVEEDGFVFVINSLKKNNTLKVLHLSHDIGARGNKALSDLLEHNFVMETLYMRSFGDPDMMARTDYFLKLNATALRGLQLDINMDRPTLVEKLEKHSDDINHAYYLLRGNPSFFNV